MTLPVLRRSDIQAWMSCAAYENDSSEAAAFGTLVHKLVADLYAGRQPEATTAGVSPERRMEAYDLALRFAETHDLGNVPSMIEETLTVETDHAIVTGTPDAVWYLDNDAALIVDWKSSWAIGDAAYQLRFYAAMLAINVPALRTFYGRADHIRLSDGVVEYGPWDREELLTWWQGIVDAIPGLLEARENPVPTGGSSCTYCRHRMTCGASISPARDVPATTEEAARLTSELVRIEAAADAHKAALRAYFAERDPMVVGGVEVGWLRSKEASFKPTVAPLTISSWLEESGYSGPAVLSLDRSKIPKAVARLLVDSGLGTFEQGSPTFKTRRAS